MFDYQFPSGGTVRAQPIAVALCVEVPYLMDVVRLCLSQGIDVMQVYDFYC